MKEQRKKKVHFDISVWAAISAITVLAVVLALMSFMQSQLQKNQAVTLFVEKGATLIQTFEAGLQNLPSQIGKPEDIFYLQKLLIETAEQPDIDYMIITDHQGQIIADSDPSMMGRPYGLDLDTAAITGKMEIRWRQTANPEGAGTFEVYRGFSLENGPDTVRKTQPWIVFVGFNMDKIEKASREDTFRMMIMAAVLALIGALAIVSLFLAQAYRLTRTSLSRMTIFSDALVKNMPIGLLAVDKNSRIITCNNHAEDFITGSCANADGREAMSILPAEFSSLLNTISGQKTLIEQDIVLDSLKDGEQIWEVVAAAFADQEVEEGKILLARNVTEVRRLVKEVTKSRHLTALGSLAAGVAHEIRNPLSSIKGFAVYFKERLSGNAEDEKTADIMIAETERLNRVISQLIEFARPIELKKEQTDLTTLVEHTARLIGGDAQKNDILIDITADTALPPVLVDPDKIKQVLLNIFLNALTSMPGGGRLSVLLSTGSNGLDVVITDTGEGINEDDLPRIYDPYFTSKPAGTGLGLAVAQKIMEAHGGKVQIESKSAIGTKVILHFEFNAAERKTT
jgi:two-component system sensor histidine kinase HydH